MAIDDSIGVLIAMCCCFFCITVIALFLYLRQQDIIRTKDGAIEDMEQREVEWEHERAELAARCVDGGDQYGSPAHKRGGAGSPAFPPADEAPPLPAQEGGAAEAGPNLILGSAGSAGGAPPYHNERGASVNPAVDGAAAQASERRWLRKQTASRLLRLSADTRYRTLRSAYNRWLRFLVSSLRAPQGGDIQYYSADAAPSFADAWQPPAAASPPPRWGGGGGAPVGTGDPGAGYGYRAGPPSLLSAGGAQTYPGGAQTYAPAGYSYPTASHHQPQFGSERRR